MRPFKRPLSPEMRSLLAALRKTRQGELPGLEVGARVRFIGRDLWQVEGERRCWQTATVHALLRRNLLTRVAPSVYRAAVIGEVPIFGAVPKPTTQSVNC